MRMFTRRKVGDTLPGSSATREERQAHNLVLSPVYKSVWAWFDSMPHYCKISTVTAWWCMQSRDGAQITHATPLLSKVCYRIIYQVHHVHRKSWKWWCAKYIGKAYQEPKFVRLEALLWRSQRHRVAPSCLKDFSLFAASLFYFFFFFFFLFTSMPNLGKSSH